MCAPPRLLQAAKSTPQRAHLHAPAAYHPPSQPYDFGPTRSPAASLELRYIPHTPLTPPSQDDVGTDKPRPTRPTRTSRQSDCVTPDIPRTTGSDAQHSVNRGTAAVLPPQIRSGHLGPDWSGVSLLSDDFSEIGEGGDGNGDRGWGYIIVNPLDRLQYQFQLQKYIVTKRDITSDRHHARDHRYTHGPITPLFQLLRGWW